MNAKEILEHKEVLNVADIEQIFQVKKSVAYRIIRSIKSISDRLGIVGRVHKKDYYDYLDRKNEGGEKVEAETSNSKVG